MLRDRLRDSTLHAHVFSLQLSEAFGQLVDLGDGIFLKHLHLDLHLPNGVKIDNIICSILLGEDQGRSRILVETKFDRLFEQALLVLPLKDCDFLLGLLQMRSDFQTDRVHDRIATALNPRVISIGLCMLRATFCR